ncbi:MAG: hypothetical protein ACYDHZ_07600, partial [Dehalococcoidia bacterium]
LNHIVSSTMKIRWLILTAVTVLAVCFGPGCGPSTPATSSSMAITNFDVNPSSITSGQSTTLSWTVTGAKTVTIDQGIGSVAASGTKSISPLASMPYTLTASDGTNSSRVTVNVTVKPATGSSPKPGGSSAGGSQGAGNKPAINSFTANPAIIDNGGVSTLQWNVSGANSVSISPLIGAVAPIGTINVTPTKSTAYALTATNAGGSTINTVKVMVPTDNSTLLPVILDFSAQPPVIDENTSTKISWSVYKANSITMDPDIGQMTGIGNTRVMPGDNETYTLTATNWYGSTTATLYVTAWGKITIPVSGRPIWVDNTTAYAVSLEPMVTWFSIEPATIIDGNTSVINWKTSHASRVLLNGQLMPAEGSKVISPSAGRADAMSMAYTLSVYNNYGSYSVAKVITVLNYKPDWFTPLN